MNLSDPKDCLYCTNNQTLDDLMIEIAQSPGFFFSRNRLIMAVAWLPIKSMCTI